MNRISLWTSLSVLLLSCSLSVLAQQSAANAIVPLGRVAAQTSTFRAYVPFPFVVANQILPAGTYQIQRLMGRPVEGEQVGMIVVRSSDRGVYKAVVTNLVPQPLEPPGDSHLVFARHASKRYLSEVRIQGEKGHRIPNVSRELELAGSTVSQEEVALPELR